MEWALKTRFNYQTGCTLTDEHLQYLYEKVFGSSSRQDRSITWTQFCKDNLIDRNFSFFNWFHEATKLTRLHLSKEWEKGLIHGFISKSKAEEMLRTCPAGTFLLRFSDSKLVGISVAWVENNADGSLNFEIMDPYLIKDFEIIKPSRSIGDFLRKLDVCTHLYPDKPKDLAFGEYYAPTAAAAAAANRCPNGYKPKIV
ncbi:signal transducer and transcription activator-like [Sitodiplosis mosellana]|uniref:signal transducer and transcription activator-like n=1 Tax=Sitodiplosis mosellana TaxID=263140 RepID=UPI0024441168|nr:signal transducer and transcription activator-like [Sitodiplosis mosellana]